MVTYRHGAWHSPAHQRTKSQLHSPVGKQQPHNLLDYDCVQQWASISSGEPRDSTNSHFTPVPLTCSQQPFHKAGSSKLLDWEPTNTMRLPIQATTTEGSMQPSQEELLEHTASEMRTSFPGCTASLQQKATSPRLKNVANLPDTKNKYIKHNLGKMWWQRNEIKLLTKEKDKTRRTTTWIRGK